ncbi:uncharacterized protein EDB91DRAFT_1248995 [Suillus paluster]|uniref:uncharacterized protein n=1 Tax=Suillus paluster TaxID=48578 RepID=UPI001B862648|nr:uncharacterized protein EDB91DRAFT_1248995 [Suillus paluster]KAG1738834.1 hypothetical protein EDB91DRAFT_1248995 [Suillus paluster]
MHPTPLPSDTLSLNNAPAQVVHPFYSSDSAATAFARATVSPDTLDAYMSITTSLKFNKHSFEELRLACLLAGKELTSIEIPTRGLLPAPAALPLIGCPRGETLR